MRLAQSKVGAELRYVVCQPIRHLQVRVRQGTEVQVKAPRALPRATPGAPLKVLN